MKLHIKNFRSIKQLDLELAPITVLYGHNGTGKSSVLYAPLTLKNIVINPNQLVQEFFNYGFARLGAFNEVIFDHNPKNELELGISFIANSVEPNEIHSIPYDEEIDYRITCLNDATGFFRFKITWISWDGEVLGESKLEHQAAFPDRENNRELIKPETSEKTFLWNGVSTNEVVLNSGDEWSHLSPHDVTDAAIKSIDLPKGKLERVSFVPLGRGFFHPSYSLQEVSPMIATEQDVTSMLATEEHLEYKIDRYMEQILNKDFRVRSRIGTSSFTLNSVDRRTGIGTTLVNDGFGVNQLVYMLAKVLHPDAGIVCIEEPEIHLHPTAIRKLARALSEIVHENTDKHLVISTHSEQFVMSLLALVAEGAHSPVDLAMYLVTKDGKESEFRRQQVNENGQIEGGFANFIEGELEDMKAFLGV